MILDDRQCKGNLIPQSERSPIEARSMGRKGGIRSGEVRRERKAISQIYGQVLANKYKIPAGENGKAREITGIQLIEETVLAILTAGGSPAVSLLKEIRESTEGSRIAIDTIIEVKLTFDPDGI